jgi:integrase
MKFDLKKLNWTTKRLADGTIKTYWYAWRGGPLLKGKPGTPEFIASYNKAVASREPVAGEKTFADLIRDYLKGGYFNNMLSPRTQSDYKKKLDAIDKKFGAMPLAACELKETRGVLRRWRDELSVTSPRQADYTWAIMSAVFKHGIQYGDITTNPCALGGRLYDGSRVEVIWASPQVGAFLHQTQYAHMHLPLLIGLWTGQREGDILRLKWSAYDGQVIRLKQRKGQRRGKKKNASAIVVIPVAEPLKAALDAARAARVAARVTPLNLEDETVCLNSEGEPWREGRDGFNGFISSFRKARDKAGIEGVSFGDLRGTAVTRLALSGCTVPEICAITGHSHAEANAILEAHYLHRDPAIAWNAIRKLETSFGTAILSTNGAQIRGAGENENSPDSAESSQTGSQTAAIVPLKRTRKSK